MANKKWHRDNPLNCPIVKTLNLFNGKWKPMVLHQLTEKTMRYGEIKKNIPNISQKVLTQQLRELERDGVIKRDIYDETILRVEYSLTEKGTKLTPILDLMYDFLYV
jgi:DNA-binding HxlR family transcriptional regulator